jgi:nucleoside-diphosphate-sugar epimerase
VEPGDEARALAGLDVEVVRGDVLHPGTLAPAFGGVEVVFHLAGVVSISSLDIDRVRTVNVTGTRNVVEAAKRDGVRRLVYASSVHALTEPPGAAYSQRRQASTRRAPPATTARPRRRGPGSSSKPCGTGSTR